MNIKLWLGLFLCGAAMVRGVERLPVEQFAQGEENYGMVLSPDGRAVAFIHDVEGRQSLVMRDLETGKTASVAMPASERAWIPQSVRIDWVNNHRLIFGLREGGFAAIEKDGSQVMGLTGRMGAIDRREYRSVLSDGVLYAYRDEENGYVLMTEYDVPAARYEGEWFMPTFPHVIKLNSRTGDKVRVETNPGNVAYWLADPQGVIRVAVETKNGIARTIGRETADAPWRPLPGMDWNDATVRPIAIGADNHTLYVKRKSPQGMWAVYPYDLVNGKFGDAVIAHELYDILPTEMPAYGNGILLQALVMSPRNDLLGVRYVTDYPRVVWFNQDIGRIQQSLDAALPGKINTIVSMSDDHRRMIVESWTADDPGTYYYFDAAKPSLTKFISRMPWIDPDKMAGVSAVEFKARDGLLIHGYLTLPRDRGRKNLPLIVYPHCGPRLRDVWAYDADVQFLANRGYAVLQVNYRGSTGYGEGFLKKGRRQVGEKTQQDITDGAQWAVSEGIADRNRLGIMGGSFGGYSVLMGLIQEPGLYKCGIDIAGVTDWIDLIKVKADLFPQTYGYNVGLVGNPKKDAAMLKQISPVYLVDAIKAPVLVIHGRDDPAVPYSQAKSLVKALDRAGKTYEFMAKYNELHGLQNYTNRVEMYHRVDAFLQKYLPAD